MPAGLLLKLAVVLLSVPLILLQWGHTGSDIYEWYRQLLFGFHFGSTQISLAVLIASVIVFALGYAAARLFQSWLDARILQPATIQEINRNQIGELNVGLLKTVTPDASNDAEFFPGLSKKWGLAYMINAEDAAVGRTAGSLAWAVLANTYYWIEPQQRVAGVVLTQILPFADPIVLNLLDQFERGIYATRS